MAYATEANLKTRFGTDEITDAPEDAGAIVSAITDAANLIDLYLGVKYTLPLTSPPAFLERLNCVIARFYLYDDKPSEHIQAEYDKAIEMLEDLMMGKIPLGADNAEMSGTSEPDYYDGVQQFTDFKMTGY